MAKVKELPAGVWFEISDETAELRGILLLRKFRVHGKSKLRNSIEVVSENNTRYHLGEDDEALPIAGTPS